MNERVLVCAALACLVFNTIALAGNYKNFDVAVYITVNVTKQMADPAWREAHWNRVASQLKVDKVYIETYRSRQIADENSLEAIKKFFTDKGIKVAGGVAIVDADRGVFRSHVYTDPKDREYVKNFMELTARHFDEIILDDFFFVSTKTDSDIAAKGDKSWTQFRLDLMDEVSENLLLKPAKAVNPKCKIIIKFPNWYEHFAGSGYDLEKEPTLFDGIYTGTETRDPIYTEQHLQAYESYQIMRYFENIAPGRNGGGWVDTYDMRYLDRYVEQLWDTMFGKAKEITLFNFNAMERPILEGDRSSWQFSRANFNYDAMLRDYQQTHPQEMPTMARVAGYSLEQVDKFLDKLGTPTGLKSYRPYHATGEDFLHNYLGMIGIPIDLYPTFPTDADVLLLTEAAKFDPDIISKIKGQLTAGKSVVITSGLLRALQGKGIEDICELRYTDRKASVTEFIGRGGVPIGSTKLSSGILIPQIDFLTNDAWALVQGVENQNGYPILLMDHYSKGTLYVLTIPDNFSDLYLLPPDVLSAIKNILLPDAPVRLNGPSQISLMTYDNSTFIVQSFLSTDANVTLSVSADFSKLHDLVEDRDIAGQPERPTRIGRQAPQGPPRMSFQLQMAPHSYQVFQLEK